MASLPSSSQCEDIARAEDAARWEALRPAPGAPPQEFIKYYEQRLAANPNDRAALKGLAYQRALMKDSPRAIQDYKKVLTLYPDDRDSKVELARLLAADGQYSSAISLYRELLATAPHDTDTLESLAHVYTWSHKLRNALLTYRQLAADHPSNIDYVVEVARLEAQRGDYAAARQILLPLLAADPRNTEARLVLAQGEIRQGRYRSSLEQLETVLKQDPGSFYARFGKAQLTYYQNDLDRARTLATTLVQEQPQNFDAIVLLAAIERALHHEREALTLLSHADSIVRGDAEVRALREKVREESGVTLHTSASYARELGRSEQTGGPGTAREDLRSSDYGTTLKFPLLRRTTSYFSMSYVPTSSSFGGIQGAVAPGEFIYRQSTEVSRFLILRGGLGGVRFGPGTPWLLPGQPEPVASAGVSVVGFAGGSVFLGKAASIDLNWGRSAIDYTPLSVRLGVIENRAESGVNFFVTPRTELHLDYYEAKYTSEPYAHVTFINPQTVISFRPDRDRTRGASIVFNRNLIHSQRFTFDSGYSALAYGFEGERLHVYMGFFNPSFYQRHLLNAHWRGHLLGPLGYDFSGDIGLQQVDQNRALRRALVLSPAFVLKTRDHMSFTLGYTYYDVAQSLGIVSGNAIKLSSDVAF